MLLPLADLMTASHYYLIRGGEGDVGTEGLELGLTSQVSLVESVRFGRCEPRSLCRVVESSFALQHRAGAFGV